MVEEYIDQWANELEAHDSNSICDVAQGPVWKKLFSSDYKGSGLCLGLSLFIDWFNPLKNKLAGRQLSMGIISLNCLNLPPRLRYQTRYTCLAGIIPSPNQPTMITINNILTPLVNELYELNKGLTILTPKYPHGRKVVVKLVTLVGDIVAVHKVAGFKSHSATKFCSWCEINASDRHKLKLGRPRKGRNVLEAAHHWKDMKSAFSREKVAMQTGVRWSELNRLPYWDPVCNIALGVMHNWFEGVLQHHFISRWGFDSKILNTYENSEASEPLQQLQEEDTRMSIDEELTLESDDENSGFLSEDLKKRIRDQICEVIVPKGVTRIPPLVGKSQIGKLKASEWNCLFSVYLPMVFTEVLWGIAVNDQTGKSFDLLLNFGSLVQCTNIVGAKVVENNYPQRFSESYSTYQHTSSKIFPKCRNVPNHHYAMHIPEQLKNWGPPMGISEFAGERLVGEIQNLKCNFLP
ncbi:hypothetical protein O181_115705, partial [Austropuccinia psidii MF-1]|nr:hypothetical protein [Austropuccinia psidii MF-1]